MNQLARKLRTLDYFTLGFGTMVGVGWLIVMDDWLQRGGPLGGVLAFLLGAFILLPVAYVYGRLVAAIPDAGSEIAYTAKVFPSVISFSTGWMMMLAYLIVCPWEAVAIGRILSFIFPRLNTVELYRVGSQPVYLPNLVIGLALTAIITYINYRGIRISATFQNWTTFGLLLLFVVFIGGGLAKGSISNLSPPFSHSGWISVLLMVQIVPYFMTGFEAVAKGSEEANPEFRPRSFFRAIVAALLVGAAFYCIIIFVVSYAYPWQRLTTQPFATAYALEQVVGGHWIVNLVLAAALLSLLKIFNGNFLASTRLLFAMGRRQMVHPAASYIHPQNQTPSVAVLAIAAITVAGLFLGSSILIPVTEVGSLASACGWLASCAAYFFIDSSVRQRMIASLGALVSMALIAIKLLPLIPGSFTKAEWIVFVLWIVVGLLVKKKHSATSTQHSAH
jgi:amino acid transporter